MKTQEQSLTAIIKAAEAIKEASTTASQGAMDCLEGKLEKAIDDYNNDQRPWLKDVLADAKRSKSQWPAWAQSK